MVMQSSYCPNCGAALTGGSGQSRTCPQCGLHAAPTAPMAAFGPPPPHAPAPRRSSSGLIWILAIAGLVLVAPCCVITIAMAGSFAAFRGAQPREPPTPVVTPSHPVEAPGGQAPEPESPPPPEYNLESRSCLLNDVDGDGARELGAMLEVGRDPQRHPAILNGATGEIRWIGEPLGTTQFITPICVGSDWLAILGREPDELRLHPITSPDGVLVHSLSDHVDRYGFTETCVALRMDDRSYLSVSLENGAAEECEAPFDHRPMHTDSVTCGIANSMRRGREMEVGDRIYRIGARPHGTPRLEAEVRRGREQLWIRPLDLMPVGGSIGCFAGAPVGDHLVVLGSSHPDHDDDTLVAVGLDADSGVEQWRRTVRDRPTRLRDVRWNGRFLVVTTTYGTVYALDPATGEVGWTL